MRYSGWQLLVVLPASSHVHLGSSVSIFGLLPCATCRYSASLRELVLSNNRLNGTIPDSMVVLRHLSRVELVNTTMAAPQPPNSETNATDVLPCFLYQTQVQAPPPNDAPNMM